MTVPSRICVFCGSSRGRNPNYMAAAVALGQSFVEQRVTLVYGGASVGLMGALADSVLASGGTVVGVIPETLVEKEVSHKGLTELHVVASMHERKALMAELADAFIALPGGFGTIDELCEILTWGQLGMHAKPIGLLNIDGYYESLLAFFDRAVSEGLVRQEHRELLLEAREPKSLLDSFASYEAPQVEKWLDRGET